MDNDDAMGTDPFSGLTDLAGTTTTVVGGSRRDEDEVTATVRQIVADVLRIPADTISPDSALTDLPYVESIKLLRIAGKLERTFGIEIENEALFRKGTMQDLAREILAARER
ncbi:hypothetical protein Cch01nite_18470 [Cellulomonas chitinilytica]|uniref:Carrier domain-containing protein n=1 Tax=Cellulomonas chitinilytica TaxID=398759 RepID=A0A919P0M2_9CELL|nr:acyl carrier protein [Cellulomonas chitinilytica]GIG21123.1 hypothetical protein Cch01nite_18470 [Cellulomonas chitinilytica]